MKFNLIVTIAVKLEYITKIRRAFRRTLRRAVSEKVARVL